MLMQRLPAQIAGQGLIGPPVYLSDRGLPALTVFGARDGSEFLYFDNFTGLAASPDGTRVYAAASSSNTLAVIDTAINKIVTFIPLNEPPSAVVVSPDGSRVYVSSSGTTLAVVDAASATVVANLTVGLGSEGTTVTPDGSKVYVSGMASNSVSVVSAHDNKVKKSVAVGAGPVGMAVTPDGSRLYVTLSNEASVLVLDATNEATLASIPVGLAPVSIAFTPDGKNAYVVNAGDNTVSVLNPATNSVVATLLVGDQLNAVAIPGDGLTAWVTHPFSGQLTFIDTATNTFRSASGNLFPGTLFIAFTDVHQPIQIDPAHLDGKSGKAITVTIFSTEAINTFSGVLQFTLTFGRTGYEASLIGCDPQPRDVNHDGLPDLVCTFDAAAAGLQAGDTVGILRGFAVPVVPVKFTPMLPITGVQPFRIN
jgi:YVTN family beta-propeller protein